MKDGKAELCPVCKGEGIVKPTFQTYKSAPLPSKKRHGCNGKGWVVIEIEYKYSVHGGTL